MMNIFHRASVRLAILYLMIIMFISMIFSIGLYRLSSYEIERSVKRQPTSLIQFIRVNNFNGFQEMLIDQEATISEALTRIKINLAIINIFIFISGGLLSYNLARRTLRPIEEAHAAQSRFTADASHELRTPISAMRIETELTLTEPNLTLKEARLQLESNIEELDKLTALSDRLLQLSKLENTKLVKSDQDLNLILEEAIIRIGPLLSEKNQKVNFRKKKVIVKTDGNSVIESFVTILENATKYSPSDSQININIEVNKKDVVIKIKDNGIGIEQKDLNKIFQRFYRADQSRTKNEVAGYGIGLSIAKTNIEAHGGNVSVESEVGQGSTFLVTLPL